MLILSYSGSMVIISGIVIYKTMIYQIFSLVLEVATGFLSGACLLRFYMQFHYISMSSRSGNPLSQFIFTLSDWIVLPLRRFLPSIGRIDTSSLVGAYFFEIAQYLLHITVLGTYGQLQSVPILGLFGIFRLSLSCITGLLIIYAVISWMGSRSIMSDLVDRLCLPILTPVRRVLPLMGGLDLSPLVVLLLVQIVVIILNNLQLMALG